MDQIKEAFQKVKSDINQLNLEFEIIKKELHEIQNSLYELVKVNDLLTKNLSKSQKIPEIQNSTHSSTHNPETSTLRHINSTHLKNSTHSSTHNVPLESLKPSNIPLSTGNHGASTHSSTDRQTDTSTDTSTGNYGVKTPKTPQISQNSPQNQQLQNQQPNPSIILNQLDNIKKDLRLKIKRLTNQEMLVLSSIYQFEEQGTLVDYSLLSQQLNLSESSIRDYIKRIINKGFPLIKEKINNKRILLRISDSLKRLATLNTLLSLREL